MGMMSKRKGKVGEREVAELLRQNGYEARRGQQYAGGGDSPDVIGLAGFHIEVKRTENFQLYSALEQAIADRGYGEVPVVFHRRNGRQWVVVLDASDFLDIIKRSHIAGTKHGK